MPRCSTCPILACTSPVSIDKNCAFLAAPLPVAMPVPWGDWQRPSCGGKTMKWKEEEIYLLLPVRLPPENILLPP